MRVFPLSNWTELDIWQYVSWKIFNRSAVSGGRAPGAGARRHADDNRRRSH
ncbi:phosphoadenosine phosphosulfate reductase family protein [Shigella flexneri]